MLTTLPFSGFYCSKWSNELDNVENNFIENEAEDDDSLGEVVTAPQEPLNLVQFVGDFFQMPRSSK